MRFTSVVSLLLIVSLMASSVDAKRIKHLNVAPQGERVVGGSTAEEGLAPYQVSLQNFYGHRCGGAIIDTDWILTAAHCVIHQEIDDLIVLTGTQNFNTFGVYYHIDRIFMHCNYDNPSMHNDIALLHLNSSIVLDDKTQIIPLQTKPMEDGDDVLLTGWGSEGVWDFEGPDRLKKINLKYLEHYSCKEALENDPDLDIGHMCTFTKVGEGACHGDSGGPLVSNGKLVGLVNWGYPCALGYPDVHASPLFYLDWIRKTMSGNNQCLK